jgi:NADH:ubiquinone oxidoreductase subunit E
VAAVSFIPGVGILKGMAVTLQRFFQEKVTVQYPEQSPQIPPRHRGRLQLLYDEHGTLKCETCFQCAQACPIECIDMGGTDTRDRFHVHWGPAEQYAERREESALRRSGRTVPDATAVPFVPIDLAPLERILDDEGYDPRRALPILERTQRQYGRLPVAALKHISHSTGAPYADLYGAASFYRHLRLEPEARATIGLCRCPTCSALGGGAIRRGLEETLGIEVGSTTADGRVRLAAIDCNGENGGEPLVTLDDARQRGLTGAGAARLAAGLREGLAWQPGQV